MLSFKKEAHIKAKVNVHDVSWRNACQYHHEEGQKKIPAARFLGFFWPDKGQKNPKNGPNAKKTLSKHKTFFVLPNDEKCHALTYEFHFSTLSTFFPFKK